MGKIIQLDEGLANKIAAGEVVERPASVVKELVENSIDAESSVIEIEIEEGGLSKIRIIDNGIGMEEDDVLMAFERHATSKIKTDHDLFRIRTLGFRGEALPSIAAVSRLELTTSTGEIGTKIILEGGEVKSFEKGNSRRGTEIIVSDLFYNTPARLKYMKTIHTELGNITDMVNRLAMSNPHISFRLSHNGRKLLHTNGSGDVRQVLAAIYGVNIAKKMIPIHSQSLDFSISGWIALPEVTRASRNYISTIVNGRFIRNHSLHRAIQEGYHTLLPIRRYPIVLIHIQMDPILVDVNVHPSKLEVRFSKEKELNELITKTIREAFKKQTLIPEGVVKEKLAKPKSDQQSFILDHLPREKVEQKISNVEVYKESIKEKLTGEENIQREVNDNIQEVKETPPLSFELEETNVVIDYLEKDNNDKSVVDNEGRIPPLYPIGQMHGTYILAQNENGLYIIDQHAAQERIKYEYFKEKVGEVEKELQQLLVPITLEYSISDYMKILENEHILREVGVFLEPFGGNSFIIRSHPVWFPKGEEKEIIEDMIEQVLQMKKVDINKLREDLAIMMSCKGSIKANHYLQMAEIQALLDKLRTTSDPFTCPHGRPIIIHYSKYELEKMFKRVM